MNRLTLLLAGAVLLSSCTHEADRVAGASALPPAWSRTAGSSAPVELGRWWSRFGDATLDRLVDEALGQNLDLAIAAARIRQARTLERIAGAERFPELDYDASATRARTRLQEAGGPSIVGNAFAAEATISWEVDLFGRIGKSVRAARQDVAAAVEDRRGVQVALIADLVADYLDLRGLDHRLTLAHDNLDAQRETERVSTARFEVGEESGIDRDRARAQAAATAAQIPALEADRGVLVHRIAVLLAEAPASLDARLARTAALPTFALAVNAGVPADLLRNRPDVRAAERRVDAAWSRVGAARADLLPRLTLSGSIGALAPSLGPGAGMPLVWSIGAGLFGPVFDGGRRRGTVQLREAERDEAISRYRQTVLTGAGEVEDALVRYDRERARNVELARAADQYTAAALRVRIAWKSGEVPFLDVLDADRSRLAAQDARALSDIAIAQDLVAIHASLGAGWSATESDEAGAIS